MARIFPLLLVLVLASSSARADTLKSEQDVKQLSERIMTLAGKGDFVGAFSAMKPYVIVPDSEFESIVLQSKSQRDQFAGRYGKSIGYEFISETKAGASILKHIYIEKTAKHALPWMLIYYKTPNGWVLNSFAWNDQIQNVFRP
jgi:hypothetical protein